MGWSGIEADLVSWALNRALWAVQGEFKEVSKRWGYRGGRGAVTSVCCRGEWMVWVFLQSRGENNGVPHCTSVDMGSIVIIFKIKIKYYKKKFYFHRTNKIEKDQWIIYSIAFFFLFYFKKKNQNIKNKRWNTGPCGPWVEPIGPTSHLRMSLQ